MPLKNFLVMFIVLDAKLRDPAPPGPIALANLAPNMETAKSSTASCGLKTVSGSTILACVLKVFSTFVMLLVIRFKRATSSEDRRLLERIICANDGVFGDKGLNKMSLKSFALNVPLLFAV